MNRAPFLFETCEDDDDLAILLRDDGRITAQIEDQGIGHCEFHGAAACDSRIGIVIEEDELLVDVTERETIPVSAFTSVYIGDDSVEVTIALWHIHRTTVPSRQGQRVIATYAVKY